MISLRFVELSSGALRDESLRLADMVAADGFSPDVVAYLARGGWPIGEAVASRLGAPLVELSAHRPGEGAKEAGSSLLPRLPRPVRHLLREAEQRVRLARGGSPAGRSVRVTGRYPVPASARRVLLVDDALDTGASVAAAVGALGEVLPGAEVRVASIAASSRSSVRPDWSLYEDVLLCTPASKDSREYESFLRAYSCLGELPHDGSGSSR